MLRFRSNNNSNVTPSAPGGTSIAAKPDTVNPSSLTSNNKNLREGLRFIGGSNQRGRIRSGSSNPSSSSDTCYVPPIHALALGSLLLVTIVEVLYVLSSGGLYEGGIVPNNHWDRIISPPHRSGSLRGQEIPPDEPTPDHSLDSPIDDYYRRPHIDSGPPVPLIVGGSDGSGTRAVVQLLEDLGVTMVVEDKGTQDVHAKELSGGEGWPGLVSKILNWTHSPDYELDDLPQKISSVASSELGSLLKNIAVAATVLTNVKGKAGGNASYVSFGFKAPVSMLLLPFFRRELPAFKMIHVVRDGRDVAFSENHSPVSKFYDIYFPISSPQRERALHANSDLGWDAMNQIKAMQLWNDWNKQVYDYGRRHADGRTLDILVLRSEDLLDDTYAAVTKVADFVGSSKTPTELCCLSRRGVKDFGASYDKSTLNEPHFFDSANFEAIRGRFHRFAPKATNDAATGSWDAIRQKMVQQPKNDHFRRRRLDGMFEYGPNHEESKGSIILRDSARRIMSVDSKARSELEQRNSKELDFNQMSQFYKRRNRNPKEVRQRYGKWVGILERNPVLSERLHQEGKDALRSFGYSPRQAFMDLKNTAADCDETVVCPT